MTERGTLAYLYWPLAALALQTMFQSESMLNVVRGWFGC